MYAESELEKKKKHHKKHDKNDSKKTVAKPETKAPATGLSDETAKLLEEASAAL